MRYFLVLKIIAIPLAVVLLGLVAYAYLGDLSPRQFTVTESIELNAD